MRPPIAVFVVTSGAGVEQVFARREDAEVFARQTPDAQVTRHPLRQSMDEAVVIFDRRVVVAEGATVLDRTTVVRQFIDDPVERPHAADLEWFLDTADAGWHIAGFGVDRSTLDAQVEQVIEEVRALSRATVTQGASS